ncbi:MAG: hypothetical protein WAU96_16460 [Anaerolineae bacterium]
MKLTGFEKTVALAGAVVDAARFVEIGLGIHSSSWPWWAANSGWIHGVSSGAFGLVLAAVIIIAAGALAREMSYALLALLTGTIVSSVIAAVAALMDFHSWLTVACAVLSPTLAVVALPIAAAIRERTEGVSPQNAPKTRTTIKGGVQVERVTETPETPVLVDSRAMSESVLAADPPPPALLEAKTTNAVPVSPLTLSDSGLRTWLTANAQANSNDAARAFGVSAPRVRQMPAWKERVTANT